MEGTLGASSMVRPSSAVKTRPSIWNHIVHVVHFPNIRTVANIKILNNFSSYRQIEVSTTLSCREAEEKSYTQIIYLEKKIKQMLRSKDTLQRPNRRQVLSFACSSCSHGLAIWDSVVTVSKYVTTESSAWSARETRPASRFHSRILQNCLRRKLKRVSWNTLA